jgi:hypothetical protein
MTDDSRPETGQDRRNCDDRGPRCPDPDRMPDARRPEPISGRGRAIGRRAGDLTPERTAAIRRRIGEGAYDSSAVLRLVARRILGSGDLGC